MTLNLHDDRDIQRLNENWEERQTDDVLSRFEGNIIDVEVPKLFWVAVSGASYESQPTTGGLGIDRWHHK